MLTTTEIFAKTEGRFIEYDGVAPNQCVDLAKYYLNKKFGIKPGSWGNAREYWYSFTNKNWDGYATMHKYFKRIANTPEFVPERGDIVLFDGKYGHIAIATGEGDVRRFKSMDQNYPTGSKVAKVTHNYTNPKFLGVLRPKFGVVSATRLNVRKGAGTTFDVVTILDKGTLVAIKEKKDGWIKIADGQWVSEKYID